MGGRSVAVSVGHRIEILRVESAFHFRGEVQETALVAGVPLITAKRDISWRM